jgi:hypothetical protein
MGLRILAVRVRPNSSRLASKLDQSKGFVTALVMRRLLR